MKNWKTTLAGIGIAAAMVIGQTGNLNPKTQSVVQQIAMIAGLLAAKDSNVTGGTVKQ